MSELPAGLTPVKQASDLPAGLTPVNGADQADAEMDQGLTFQQRLDPRREAIGKTIEDLQTGEVGPILGGIQLAGNSVILPLLWDLPAEVLETGFETLPDSWQQSINDGADSFFKTEVGQKISSAANSTAEEYRKVKKEYPQEVKAFESLVPLLGLQAGKAVGGAVIKGKKAVGATLRGARAVKRGVKPSRGARKALESVTPPLTPTELAKQAENKIITMWRKDYALPTNLQERFIEATKKVPGFRAGNPAQFNVNAVKEEISRLGSKLTKELTEANVPLPHNNATKAVIDKVKTVMGQGDPLLANEFVFDLPKKTVGNVIARANRIIRKHPPTAGGLLAARKELDKFITSKQKTFFGPDGAKTPISELYDEVRTVMNDGIESAVKRQAMLTGRTGNLPAVLDSLSQQRTLISVKEVLKAKAGPQAAGPIGRTLQKAEEAIPRRAVNIQRARRSF